MKSLFASLILVAVFAADAHATVWDGDYSGDCGSDGKHQCDLVMKDIKKGKIDASLTITARGNNADVKCEIHGTFTPVGHSLQGQFTQSNRKITISESTSGVLFSGVGGKANACGTQLDGDFDIMGE